MVYLIGGAPQVGKSIFARQLAERSGFPLVQTDEVCDRVCSTLSERECAEKFPFPGFSGNPLENTLSPEEQVHLQVVSATSLEVELERLISQAVEKNESLIIEGIQILPVFVERLFSAYGKERFQVVFVGWEDLDLVAAGISANKNPDNWLRNSRIEVIRQVAEFTRAFSRYIRIETEKRSLKYVERTEDFEGDLRKFMDFFKKSPR